MPQKKTETEVEKAQRLLQEDHQKKVDACNKEIEAVLEKYDMAISARAIIQLIPK